MHSVNKFNLEEESIKNASLFLGGGGGLLPKLYWQF